MTISAYFGRCGLEKTAHLTRQRKHYTLLRQKVNLGGSWCSG